MKNLPVPYFSQYDFSVQETWRPRACTIVNLFMALLYFGKAEGTSIQELIAKGESLGGFTEHGWKHDTILELAHAQGIPAYREEFRNKDDKEEEGRLREAGWEKIWSACSEDVLPIVSIRKENGSYHTVLIVGSDERGLFYHDPEVGPNLFISKEDFMSSWRGLVMFIGLE
ncbi:MAG: hypothetical protein KBD16_01900 [Candidatus Pacebacteria bacterium]|nr:hypothetical protein [Candidatus Paceibacterota bacterium]